MGLFDTIGGIIGGVKQTAVQETVRSLLNEEFKSLHPGGEPVEQLEIDSHKKTIRMEVLLEGEASPVTIGVASYRLIERAGGTFMELSGLHTSRPWLNALLKHQAPDGRIVIPRALPEIARLAL